MPSRIIIACEHCGAKMTLADDSKLGKKIKCPKCSEVFIASAGDEDEDDDEDDRPRRKAGTAASAQAKKGKGGKGKSKKSGGNAGLLIGGAIGVAVLLIGGLVGVLFATGILGGAPKADPNRITVAPASGKGVVGKLLQEPAATPAPSAAPKNAAETPAPKAESVAPPPATPKTSATLPAVTTPSGPSFDQKWLPAKTEVLVRVRVADLWASPLVASFATGPQVDEFLATIKQYGDLEPSMIESVTLVVHGAQDWLVSTKIANDSNSPNKPKPSPPGLVIVSLKKPFDLPKLAQAPPFAKYDHKGGQYVQVEGLPNLPEPIALYAPDPQTVLISDADGIKSAMDAGPNSSTRPELSFLDGSQHILVAGLSLPLDPQLVSQAEQMKVDLPAYVAQQAQYAEKVHGGSFGLKIAGGIEATTVISCKTPDAAQEMKAMIEMGTSMMTTEYQSNKGTMPPFATGLLDFLVNNLKTTEQNQVIQITTNIPDSAQEKLMQLPANLMLMAATSGMMNQGGGGGNPLSGLLGGLPGGEMFGGGSSGSLGDGSSIPISDLSKNAETTPEEGPGNIKLTASLIDIPLAYANPGAAKSKSKKKERVINMTVHARWIGSKEECQLAAAGVLKSKGGEAADGKKIKVALSTIPGLEAKPNEMRPISLGQYEEPAVQLGQLQITFDADETEPLKSVSGTFSVVTGKQVKQVTIPNVREMEGKEFDDEDLKAAGLQVKVVKAKGPINNEAILVTVKDGYLLSSLESVDGSGNPTFGTMTETEKSERSQRLVIFDDDVRQRKDLGVQAYLYSDLKSVTVPFKFENLEIPKALEVNR